MNCMFFGESDKAFFKTDELLKVRKIYKPVYPKPTYETFKDKNFKYVPKKDNEIRILSCDIAMIGSKQNDASVFELMQLFPIESKQDTQTKFKGYERVISYIETMVGVHSELQAIRIRQLYDDLDADYIVLDRQGNGISVYDDLCRRLYDKERDIEYEPFMSINEEKMQERCFIPNAEKKIYTISGTSEFNSDIAYSLKNNIVRNKIKLLVDRNDSYEFLGKINNFSLLPAEIIARLEAPYANTDALINEMVLLEGEINATNGQLKLKEQSGQRKDRYSSLAYANHFASILEQDLMKESKTNDMEDFFIQPTSLPWNKQLY